jgi:hypothetical protein
LYLIVILHQVLQDKKRDYENILPHIIKRNRNRASQEKEDCQGFALVVARAWL